MFETFDLENALQPPRRCATTNPEAPPRSNERRSKTNLSPAGTMFQTASVFHRLMTSRVTREIAAELHCSVRFLRNGGIQETGWSYVSPEHHIKIVNPLPGGHSHMKHAHAKRLVRRGDARFDEAGRLVLVRRSEECAARTQPKRGALLRVEEYSGCDAFPGRAVFPPSPEVLFRMCPPRAPLRPPIQARS